MIFSTPCLTTARVPQFSPHFFELAWQHVRSVFLHLLENKVDDEVLKKFSYKKPTMPVSKSEGNLYYWKIVKLTQGDLQYGTLKHDPIEFSIGVCLSKVPPKDYGKYNPYSEHDNFCSVMIYPRLSASALDRPLSFWKRWDVEMYLEQGHATLKHELVHAMQDLTKEGIGASEELNEEYFAKGEEYKPQLLSALNRFRKNREFIRRELKVKDKDRKHLDIFLGTSRVTDSTDPFFLALKKYNPAAWKKAIKDFLLMLGDIEPFAVAAMRLNAMKNRTKWLTQEQMDRMPGLPNSYWGRIIYDEPLLHDSWLDVAKKYKILVWNKDTREYDYNRRERITEEEKEKVKKIWTTAISDFKKTDYKLLYDGVMRLAKEEPKLEDQIVSLKRLHDQQKRELIHRLPFTWKDAVEILFKVGAELALLYGGEAAIEMIKNVAAGLKNLKIGQSMVLSARKHTDYVYKTSDDSVRISIYRTESKEWDYRIFDRASGKLTTWSDDNGDYFRSKNEALATAKKSFPGLRSINPSGNDWTK